MLGVPNFSYRILYSSIDRTMMQGQGCLVARDPVGALIGRQVSEGDVSLFSSHLHGHSRSLRALSLPLRRQPFAIANALVQRRPQNAEGEFFVDHRCIDCDVCRWMAPRTFTRVDGQSAVFHQPGSEEERLKALQALLSCPTASIHTEKPPKDILQVQKTFPLPIDEKALPGIYHCGYHSVKSYGAASYLIVHPEGNILFDSPSYKEKLARNIDMLGGVRYMVLSHKDDIADHDKWAKRMKCERIMHSMEINDSTAEVEKKLTGSGPWSLYPDFDIIHTPGHTEGSICLLCKPLEVLFAGDHIAKSQNDTGLSIHDDYNWYSVPEQLKSVKKLIDLDFKWILPGHGRRAQFRDIQEKNSALETLLARMEQPKLQLVS